MTISTKLAVSNSMSSFDPKYWLNWRLFLVNFVDKDGTTKVYIPVHPLGGTFWMCTFQIFPRIDLAGCFQARESARCTCTLTSGEHGSSRDNVWHQTNQTVMCFSPKMSPSGKHTCYLNRLITQCYCSDPSPCMCVQYICDVQYIRGCSVHCGDTMSTSGGYQEYIGACSVHWGGYLEYIGAYHEYIGDVQYIGGIP